MCEPTTLIAVGTAILGTVTSVIGASQQAKAQQGQANYDAAVARNNTIIANRAAEDAILKGKAAERKERIETAQTLGRQRASAASRGVDVNQGTIVDLMADTAGIGELDALTIRSNAEREAIGFRTQAGNFTSEAEMLVAQGKNAKQAGRINVASSLLGGASSVASKWNALK